MMNNTTSKTPSARILIIDDEPQIRQLIDISLRSQGYTTMLAASGMQGLTLLANKSVDLVLLDLGLPDMDGQNVLTELRRLYQIPVIILTVRSSEVEKVKLLDAGANDYVTKPFGMSELMARIRASLRTTMQTTSKVADFDDGCLYVSLAEREVRINGESLSLTKKEFSLLSILVQNPGRLITQTQLLRGIWGPVHEEDTHYLRILVGKLRSKLNDSATSPKYIVTEPGVGIRFIGSEQTPF